MDTKPTVPPPMVKKVLLAMDGSIYSSNSLNYVAKLFKGMADIEFHLLTILPSSIAESERAWINKKDLKSGLDANGRRQYESAEQTALKAVALLCRHGLCAEQIHSRITASRAGLASDLLHEAKTGTYDALILGRRGLGKLQELVLGSVSKAVLQKCRDLPIWLIDGKVNSRKFLVPVDGTVHSLRAVDHLAFILRSNPHAEVTLFNSPEMFSGKGAIDPTPFYNIWEKPWCDEHLSRPDSLYHAPEQILVENGFPLDRIHRMETHLGLYPSRQIVRQALIDDFGTIVMGRRAEGVKKGLFGSVTEKVLYMAEQVAIWIVG